ncbi:MAG: MBL fold metallo-hydrolase [Elusimicrobia bacterium]|nr:MBL fold metallo-hydrolase [Elusimicrobiota bacterium]
MKIKFLGTGSAIATSKRDNTSILFEYNAKKVLVDCPGSIVSKLRYLKVDFRELDALIITHFHPDHVYGLPSLIHSLKPFGRYPDIFVPEKLYGKTLKLLEIFNLSKTAEVIPVTIKDPPVTVKDKIEKFNTTFFKPRHTPASLGIKIFSREKAKERSLIYTSDTGPMDKSATLFKDINCLIHDCYAPASFKSEISELDKTHSSALKVGEIAAAAGVKKLFPVHFSGETKFSINLIIKEIRKNYSGQIIIPEDLKSYTV